MKKVIILSRVSSNSQSNEQQIKDLMELAYADGYKNKDIVVISNKESAIKNDEEHRLGLTEMKEVIETNPIECVYVREISRIGRREEVNLSIKNFLVERKIQLVVKTPSIRLLDADGSVNTGAELAFSLFNTMSKQEMQIKLDRFAQGKREAVAKGKVIGAKILYGYTKDDENHIVIDDAIAEIVRYIFTTYAFSDSSTSTIYKELVSRGQARAVYSCETGGVNFIRNIITNPAYYGGRSKTNRKIAYNYPAIVSEDLWRKANDKLKTMKNQPKENTKYIIYTKGLVKCHCGHIMIGSVDALLAYRCPVCKQVINLNVIEHVAWSEAILYKTEQLREQPEINRKKYQQTIDENLGKIAAAKKQMVSLESAMDRAYKGYVLGDVKDSVFTEMQATIKKEKAKVQSTIAKLKESNVNLLEMIRHIEEIDDGAAFHDLTLLTDDVLKRKLIHEVIDYIQLSKLEEGILITIFGKNGNEAFNKYLYVPSTRPKTYHVYYKTMYDKKTDSFYKDNKLSLYKEITNEIVKRFKRRRY